MSKSIKEEYLRFNIIVNGDPARKEIMGLEQANRGLARSNKELRAEQRRLKAEGKESTALYKQNATAIKENDAAIKANKSHMEQLRSQIKITSMTTAELSRRQTELRNAMRNVVPGTPQWKQLRSELQAVSGHMAQLRAETTATEGAIGSMAGKVNKYIGTATASIAALVMFGSKIYKAVQTYAELDEAMSNARKTTGMTREQVEELNRSLARIDTRTSQNELLSLARIGGKLGIAKKDIQGFTRAADVIKISLGRDLGDDVEATIGQIGKLVNVFHINREFGIEQGMMKTAAAVNELGKASTANEANIVEFMRRVGGIASVANLSAANMAGLGAMLDNVGVTMEVAGTSMSQVITGMYRRTDAFAAAAKMSVKDFRKLMNEDMNEAILRFAEGMGSSGEGVSRIVEILDSLHLNGQRATGVLTALAANTDQLRQQQKLANEAFNEGISCQKEFNIMNSTSEAIAEKLKKRITAEAAKLGRSLVPAYNESLTVKASFLKATRLTVEWMLKNRSAVVGLIAAYASYRTALFTVNSATKVYKGTVNALLGIKHTYLLTMRATRIALVAETGTTKAATIATRMFGAALKSTPLGWIAAGFGAAAGVIAFFATRAGEAARAQRTLNSVLKAAAQVEDEHGVNIAGKAEKVRLLMREVENTTTAENRRAEAIRELQALMPGGIDLINRETIANGNAAESVKAYSEQLLLQAKLKAAIQAREDLIEQHAKDQLTGEDRSLSFFQKMTVGIRSQLSGGLWNMSDMVVKTMDRNLKKSEEAFDHEIRAINNIIADTQARIDTITLPDPTHAWELEKDRDYLTEKNTLEERFRNGKIKSEMDFQKQMLQLEIDTLRKRIDANIDTEETLNALRARMIDKQKEMKGLSGTHDYTTAVVTPDESGVWNLDKDKNFLEQKALLRQKYADGEASSEQLYQNELLAIEIKTLQQRLDANTQTGAQREKIAVQLADKIAEQKKREAQMAQVAENLRIQNMTDATERENAEYERRKKELAGNNAALEQLEIAHNRKINQIGLQRALDAFKQMESQYKQERTVLEERHRLELKQENISRSEQRRIKREQTQELKEFDQEYLKNSIHDLQELQQSGTMTFRDMEGMLQSIDLDTSLFSEQEKNNLLQRIQEVLAQLRVAEEQMQNKVYSFKNESGGSILGFSENDWKIFFDHLKEGRGGIDDWTLGLEAAAEAARMALDIYAGYDKLMSAQENADLKKYKKNNDAKKKDLQNRLDHGMISQEQYNQKVEQLDADYDKKQEEIEIKQAKRQKAMSIADAMINTAVGITKALAECGPISGPIMAAIVGATGAAQIAMILATPIPGAEEGGMVVSRAQDGKKYNARIDPHARGYVDRPTVLVGENGMEYVIPNEAMDNPSARPIIDVFEAVRRRGRLRDFNFEAVLPALYPTPGRARGGRVTASITDFAGIGRNTSDGSDDMRKVIELLEYLCKKANDPVPAVLSMLGRGGVVEMQAKLDKLRKRGQLGG